MGQLPSTLLGPPTSDVMGALAKVHAACAAPCTPAELQAAEASLRPLIQPHADPALREWHAAWMLWLLEAAAPHGALSPFVTAQLPRYVREVVAPLPDGSLVHSAVLRCAAAATVGPDAALARAAVPCVALSLLAAGVLDLVATAVGAVAEAAAAASAPAFLPTVRVLQALMEEIDDHRLPLPPLYRSRARLTLQRSAPVVLAALDAAVVGGTLCDQSAVDEACSLLEATARLGALHTAVVTGDLFVLQPQLWEALPTSAFFEASLQSLGGTHSDSSARWIEALVGLATAVTPATSLVVERLVARLAALYDRGPPDEPTCAATLAVCESFLEAAGAPGCSIAAPLVRLCAAAIADATASRRHLIASAAALRAVVDEVPPEHADDDDPEEQLAVAAANTRRGAVRRLLGPLLAPVIGPFMAGLSVPPSRLRSAVAFVATAATLDDRFTALDACDAVGSGDGLDAWCLLWELSKVAPECVVAGRTRWLHTCLPRCELSPASVEALGGPQALEAAFAIALQLRTGAVSPDAERTIFTLAAAATARAADPFPAGVVAGMTSDNAVAEPGWSAFAARAVSQLVALSLHTSSVPQPMRPDNAAVFQHCAAACGLLLPVSGLLLDAALQDRSCGPLGWIRRLAFLTIGERRSSGSPGPVSCACAAAWRAGLIAEAVAHAADTPEETAHALWSWACAVTIESTAWAGTPASTWAALFLDPVAAPTAAELARKLVTLPEVSEGFRVAVAATEHHAAPSAIAPHTPVGALLCRTAAAFPGPSTAALATAVLMGASSVDAGTVSATASQWRATASAGILAASAAGLWGEAAVHGALARCLLLEHQQQPEPGAVLTNVMYFLRGTPSVMVDTVLAGMAAVGGGTTEPGAWRHDDDELSQRAALLDTIVATA